MILVLPWKKIRFGY